MRRIEGGDLFLGAATTYTELMDPTVASYAPALASAARTVGSPQIRNAGTIGGNLATASPAGDTLPVLRALGASVEIAAPGRDRRRIEPLGDFLDRTEAHPTRSGRADRRRARPRSGGGRSTTSRSGCATRW